MMNQIDGDALVVGGDDDYGFDDGVDDELLGIDIDSLVATRDTEKEEDNLQKVIEGLEKSAAWEIIFEYFLVKYLCGRED